MPCGRATWATLMNWPGPASGTCSSLRRIYAVRRSLTAVLALSLCSASALAADTLRIDIKGLDGDLAANARAWVEPLEKAGYTDTPAARMNVDKAVRLSLRALLPLIHI